MAATLDPDNLPLGTNIGVYTIVCRVAAGGFGTLYRVERDGRHYALKLSHVRLGALSPEKRRGFEDRTDREVAALKSLHHPNIVSVLAVDRWPELEDGYPLLVMEFVEGEPLDRWCRAASASLLRICDVFEKIARAIHYMHERQLFHRDLKSENVLVRSGGEPILIDFGIARFRTSSRLTRQTEVVGTCTHHAPEYLSHVHSEAFGRGEDFEWTAATDLHSVGYMLYEVLAGRPPFAGEGEAEVWRAIQTLVPPVPSLVNRSAPAALDRVVQRLLEKNPLDRFESGLELADALRRAREDHLSDAAWAEPFEVHADGAVSSSASGAVSPRSPRTAADEEEIAPIPGAISSGLPEAAPLQVAAPSQRAGAVVPFAAPTNVPVFMAPGHETPSPRAAASKASPSVPTAVRRVREAFEKGDRPNSRWPRTGIVLALGAPLVLLAFLVAVGSSTRADPRPSSLITRVERDAARTDAVTTASEPVPLRIPANVPLPPPPVRSSSSRVPPSGGSSPSPEDAGRIEPDSVAPGGGSTIPRGQVGPGERPGEDSDPAWMQRSRPILAPRAIAQKTALGIPTGAHIPVRLLTMLDSRTVGSGPVEVKVARPVVVRGEVVLPPGTLMYGQASASDGRFTIRFAKLRLPDDRELEFSGLALDHDDGRAGLAAARKIAPPAAPQGDGVGKSIARNTAGVLLGTLSGGVAQDVARSAGQTALSYQDPVSTASGETYLLDPGAFFDVWVERAF